jgi:hypothetical protein
MVFSMILGFVNAPRADTKEQIDRTWVDRAIGGIKAASEKHQEIMTHLEEMREVRVEKLPGAVSKARFSQKTIRDRLIQQGDNRLVEEILTLDDMPSSSSIRLYGLNSDYYFTLGKSREEAPYALAEYNLGKPKNPFARGISFYQESLISTWRWALGALEGDGTHILQELRFDEGKQLLLIRFTTQRKDGPPTEDHLYVDPSHDWRVVERRIENPYLTTNIQVTYGITVAGLEFPSGERSETSFKAANYQAKFKREAPPANSFTVRILSLKLTDKTRDDFRLAAFGLPEPVDVAPPVKPTRWYLWLLAAAGVSAALALGFASLRRRRLSRLVAPPM